MRLTHCSSIVALMLIAACPQDPADTSVSTSSGDEPAVSTSSTTEVSTEADATQTGTTSATDSTGDIAPTSTGDEPTTGTPAEGCGIPADECESTNREWCADVANLCDETPLSPPSGSNATDYCVAVGIQCGMGTAPCQMCNYIANTCKQLGGGTSLCDDELSDCLCRAQLHELSVGD